MLGSWFPKIDSTEMAMSQAKVGGYGGVAFLVMNLIGIAFLYFYSQSASTGESVSSEDVMFAMLGMAIVLPFLLFLTYRVFKGKGWLAAIVLITWFLFEITNKVANGTFSAGWIICYLVILASLVNGFRGCWYLKQNKDALGDGG